MEDSDTGSEGGTPMGENCNDDESDGEGLSLEEIKHAMATYNNHDDETQDNGDCELAELHRIMAAHNDKISASAILSQTLKCAQHSDSEFGGAHICEEDESDDDIAMAGGDEPFKERVIQIAMDSGAGKNVAPPELLDGYKVVPSYGSKHNKHFVAANGGKILNLGESELNFDDGAGSRLRSTFQVAEVSRMLYSVSQLCDAGCDVSFNRLEGTAKKNGKVVAKFPRKGGLYVMTTTLKAPSAHHSATKANPEKGFARQD